MKATYALERRGLQQDKPEASKGSRAFSMHQLDKETKSFLHKALADVDAALKNYAAVEDTKGATGKKGATAKEKLLAERAGVGKRGKESKGKERAESKGKAKADAKKGNKREPSELEKSLKGESSRRGQLKGLKMGRGIQRASSGVVSSRGYKAGSYHISGVERSRRSRISRRPKAGQ